MIIDLNIYDPDYYLSSSFSTREFRCHCGCQRLKIDERLVEALQALRDAVGSVLRVTSGYRCKAHNKKIGGVWNSRHMRGEAADIAAEDPDALAKIAVTLCDDDGAGDRVFKRIGIYPKRYFVHLGISGFGFRTWRK